MPRLKRFFTTGSWMWRDRYSACMYKEQWVE